MGADVQPRDTLFAMLCGTVFRKLSDFRVYCDESNTDGRKRHPVYGARSRDIEGVLLITRATAAVARVRTNDF
jgi:hypothetical protein